MRNFESSGRSSVMELFVLQSDITGRDKDHVSRGLWFGFVSGGLWFGLWLWFELRGC